MPQIDPTTEAALRADVERLAGELDKAIARLEASGEGADWKIRARLLRLEAQYLIVNLPKPKPPPSSLWRRAGAGLLTFLERLSPIATPIVLTVFAFLLTGTTTQFLDLRKVELTEQQLDLSTIQALDGHLASLRQEDIGREVADQIARRIAYFGPRAVVPLVAELGTVMTDADPRAEAIAAALQVSALYPGQRVRLCAVLAQARSKDLNKAYSDAGRKVAGTLSTSLGCEDGGEK